jgi:hypothetical protein
MRKNLVTMAGMIMDSEHHVHVSIEMKKPTAAMVIVASVRKDSEGLTTVRGMDSVHKVLEEIILKRTVAVTSHVETISPGVVISNVVATSHVREDMAMMTSSVHPMAVREAITLVIGPTMAISVKAATSHVHTIMTGMVTPEDMVARIKAMGDRELDMAISPDIILTEEVPKRASRTNVR